jgi:signal transduction histidine kinase
MDESEGIKLFQTLVPLIGLVVLIALGVVLMVHQFQRSLFRQRLSQENLKLKQQQELLRTAIAVQEQERQRIASDLHDELGARLSVALRLLRQGYGTTQVVQETSNTLLPQLEEHLEQALDSTRRISYELMPPQLVNLGLHSALLVLVEEVRIAGRLQVGLTQSGTGDHLPWTIQLGLYRMISELLHNTLKHAEATQVYIELKETSEWVMCHYQDNGKGISTDQKPNGLGLQSLKARTTSLDGKLEWGTGAAGGFFANIHVPMGTEKKTDNSSNKKIIHNL